MKADPAQKRSEEVDAAAGLGPDLTASVETTYSEQSSSSAGSSSSSDQPIYFRYVYTKNMVTPRVAFTLAKIGCDLSIPRRYKYKHFCAFAYVAWQNISA